MSQLAWQDYALKGIVIITGDMHNCDPGGNTVIF